MEERFARLPRSLAQRTITTRLATIDPPFDSEGVPALLAHPDESWNEPGASPSRRPVVLWMHGRTVSKELDPGRYLRWLKAGIATCAIDLPWHGERADETKQDSDWTLRLAERAVVEVDRVVEDLADPRFNDAFDPDRVAIGGMSAGGMVTLIRLCRPHRFACACVEATAGDFRAMEGHTFHVPDLVERLNPATHLDEWRPIPLLSLHSEADAWVPFGAMRGFIDTLRAHYESRGADPTTIELVTWPQTGAHYEHMGFGRVSNDAKNIQTDFLARHLSP